jgi:cupin 2 domain-containing protein
MLMDRKNIFNTEELSRIEECFIPIYSNQKIFIEKIVSFGQTTPENDWLEQDRSEWVALLQGEAEILFENDIHKVSMKRGDYIHIPSHCKHKVTFTSVDPPCIWLAVHFDENGCYKKI